MKIVTQGLDNLKSRDLVELECEECGLNFKRIKSLVMRGIRGTRSVSFCSSECAHSNQRVQRIECTCAVCGTGFSRLQKDIKRNTFCSKSCAAKYNNVAHPKRKKTSNQKRAASPPRNIPCAECGVTRTHSRAKICSECIKIAKIKSYGERKISSFVANSARHKYQKIRHHAHRTAKLHNFQKVCGHPACNYSRKVELAHIKPISTFDKETPLHVVNDPANLIYLCPNHHHELDDGVLKLL
jgi:HNH endonuclease